MKSFFDGIKRAKVRSILSALIALVAAAAICITLGISVKSGGGSAGGRMDKSDSSFSQFDRQGEESSDVSEMLYQTAVSDESTDDEGTTDGDADGAQGSLPNGQGNMRGGDMSTGASYITYIIAAAIGVVALILLIIVNVVSTKKRKNEFQMMKASGIPVKAIKKQLFIEAFVVVLILGAIGVGVGAAVSQPVSNFIASQTSSQEDFSSDESGDIDREMPDDFDSENMPEMSDDAELTDDSGATDDNMQVPDGDMQMPDDSEMPDFDSGSQGGDFDGGENSGSQGVMTNQSQSIWLNAVIGLVSVLIMAAAAGLACALPVGRKKKNGEPESADIENAELDSSETVINEITENSEISGNNETVENNEITEQNEAAEQVEETVGESVESIEEADETEADEPVENSETNCNSETGNSNE